MGAAEGYRSMRRQALPPNRAKGLRPHKSLHDAHYGRLRGRPCRASLYGGLPNPGFGRPCRATHPGLWGGIAPVGLLCVGGCLTQGLVALAGLRTLGFEKGRPAGAYTAARELKELDYRGIIPHPALHGIKGPCYRKGPCWGKEPLCGSPLQGFGNAAPRDPQRPCKPL